MFTPGQIVHITCTDDQPDSGGRNFKVEDYQDGLLRVTRRGKEFVYNLHSSGVMRVEISQRHAAEDE